MVTSGFKAVRGVKSSGKRCVFSSKANADVMQRRALNSRTVATVRQTRGLSSKVVTGVR